MTASSPVSWPSAKTAWVWHSRRPPQASLPWGLMQSQATFILPAEGSIENVAPQMLKAMGTLQTTLEGAVSFVS